MAPGTQLTSRHNEDMPGRLSWLDERPLLWFHNAAWAMHLRTSLGGRFVVRVVSLRTRSWARPCTEAVGRTDHPTAPPLAPISLPSNCFRGQEPILKSRSIAVHSAYPHSLRRQRRRYLPPTLGGDRTGGGGGGDEFKKVLRLIPEFWNRA
jgi:hypothetical protein